MTDEIPMCDLPDWSELRHRLASVGSSDPDIESFYSLLQPLAGCSMSGSGIVQEMKFAIDAYTKQLSPGAKNVLQSKFRDYLHALIDNNEALDRALAIVTNMSCP